MLLGGRSLWRQIDTVKGRWGQEVKECESSWRLQRVQVHNSAEVQDVNANWVKKQETRSSFVLSDLSVDLFE